MQNAVDNLLRKIKDKKIPFVRIASNLKYVHPEIVGSTKMPSSFKERYEIDDMISSNHIYATDIFGVTYKLIGTIKKFDYAVFHEAN